MAPTAPDAAPAGSIASGTTPRGATTMAALARGRTCYDHLAGRLGVVISDAMVQSGLLSEDEGFALTDAGRTWLTTVIGVEPVALRATRRPLVRACLDWTERRSHLAGVAGAQLCCSFLNRDWIRRLPPGRAVRLTEDGALTLREMLDIDPAGLT